MIEFNATFLVAMLSFSVFIIIMNAIFYNPILSIIKKRDEYIESNYQNSKEHNEKAQLLDKEYEEKLNDAKENGRHKVALALENAQKKSFEKTQKAKEDIRNDIQIKKDELTAEKNELQKKLESESVQDIAQTIVSKFTEGIN